MVTKLSAVNRLYNHPKVSTARHAWENLGDRHKGYKLLQILRPRCKLIAKACTINVNPYLRNLKSWNFQFCSGLAAFLNCVGAINSSRPVFIHPMIQNVCLMPVNSLETWKQKHKQHKMQPRGSILPYSLESSNILKIYIWYLAYTKSVVSWR